VSEGLRKRKRRYTNVPSATIDDPGLSFKALGVLVNLLNKPPGWKVRSVAIADSRPWERRDSIQGALKQMGAAGYYRIERRHLLNGQILVAASVSEEPVASWAAEHAEYDGPVPVIEQPGGTFLVRHKDGSLSSDGFDGFEDEPPPSDPPDSDVDPSDPEDDVCPGQAETGFSGSGESGAGDTGSGETGSGSAGAGKPGPFTNTEESVREPSVPAETPDNTPDSEPGAPSVSANGHGRHRRTRVKIVRDPAEQALFDSAAAIAARWWEYRKQHGPVVGNRFPGFRDNIVLAALRGGATEQQVKDALVACGETFPSVGRFEQVLRGESRFPRSGNGHAPYTNPPDNSLYQQRLGSA
jgi:hypothetical protein